MARRLTVVAALALIPGCGLMEGLFGIGSAGHETGSSKLKPFQSERELAAYFADQITTRNDRPTGLPSVLTAPEDGATGAAEGVATPPAASDGGASAGEGGDAVLSPVDFSQTTIQEEGVDEPDVVKTDGTRLYIIHGDSLKIVRARPPEPLALLADVSLEGFGREIFLHDGRVIALTEIGGGFVIAGGSETAVVDPGFAPGFEFQRPRTVVTVIDVSAPDTPAVLSQTTFDGSMTASRMIDGVLHLVLANFETFYVDVLPTLGQPELEVGSVDVEALLPQYDRVDAAALKSSGPVVTWRELYRPTDPDGFGVVTVVSLDVDADAAFTAVGVVAEPGLVYSSREALYLTDTAFDFSGRTRVTTDIYKFTYAGRGTVPAATGSVPGRILNQFSMGEYARHLRVATTVGPTFSLFGNRLEPVNSVYVLAQVDDALTVVGSLEGLARGETIQSARFIADRGYLVTFEQVDPLFTLDLSDPAHPRAVGKLEVPGFSTFIVPIDADHLLTVGRHLPAEAPFFPGGVQLSIFDVSRFDDPQRTANVILTGGGGADSEALHNQKAFTYFAERGLVALPVTIREDVGFVDVVFSEEAGSNGSTNAGADEGGDRVQPGLEEPVVIGEPVVPEGFEGLAAFRVSIEDGFTELGRIDTRVSAAPFFGPSFTRGVFIGDDVFAVTDRAVRGASLDDIESVPYELLFDGSQPVGPE